MLRLRPQHDKKWWPEYGNKEAALETIASPVAGGTTELKFRRYDRIRAAVTDKKAV